MAEIKTIYVLYTNKGGIIDYYDTRKEAEDFVWQVVNRKPRVSLDENELRHYANFNFVLVSEPTSNIIEDFKYTLKSLGMLSISTQNIRIDGDANYYRNLRVELDNAANRVTGYHTSEYWAMGDASPSTDTTTIRAGEPVAFRRSNWEELYKDHRTLVFDGLEPITEERAEFLQAVYRPLSTVCTTYSQE